MNYAGDPFDTPIVLARVFPDGRIMLPDTHTDPWGHKLANMQLGVGNDAVGEQPYFLPGSDDRGQLITFTASSLADGIALAMNFDCSMLVSRLSAYLDNALDMAMDMLRELFSGLTGGTFNPQFFRDCAKTQQNCEDAVQWVANSVGQIFQDGSVSVSGIINVVLDVVQGLGLDAIMQRIISQLSNALGSLLSRLAQKLCEAICRTCVEGQPVDDNSAPAPPPPPAPPTIPNAPPGTPVPQNPAIPQQQGPTPPQGPTSRSRPTLTRRRPPPDGGWLGLDPKTWTWIGLGVAMGGTAYYAFGRGKIPVLRPVERAASRTIARFR